MNAHRQEALRQHSVRSRGFAFTLVLTNVHFYFSLDKHCLPCLYCRNATGLLHDCHMPRSCGYKTSTSQHVSITLLTCVCYYAVFGKHWDWWKSNMSTDISILVLSFQRTFLRFVLVTSDLQSIAVAVFLNTAQHCLTLGWIPWDVYSWENGQLFWIFFTGE